MENRKVKTELHFSLTNVTVTPLDSLSKAIINKVQPAKAAVYSNYVSKSLNFCTGI
jgi:hypothetical protein